MHPCTVPQYLTPWHPRRSPCPTLTPLPSAPRHAPPPSPPHPSCSNVPPHARQQGVVLPPPVFQLAERERFHPFGKTVCCVFVNSAKLVGANAGCVTAMLLPMQLPLVPLLVLKRLCNRVSCYTMKLTTGLFTVHCSHNVARQDKIKKVPRNIVTRTHAPISSSKMSRKGPKKGRTVVPDSCFLR